MSTQPYQVEAINAFSDNYIWLIKNSLTNTCVVVDPGDAKPVINTIKRHGLVLEAILITHHHPDHTGGVTSLLKHFEQDIAVYGPCIEAQDVVTHPLDEGDIIRLNTFDIPVSVLAVPGHTLGHIAYVTPTSLFCGDTLFAAGCGRMFEGDAQQFQHSLAKLAMLPPATKVYCAHEYTLANLAFARAVSPQCASVAQRICAATELRSQGLATIPSTIAQELATNPFLRLNESAIAQAIANFHQQELATTLSQRFAGLRLWKDNF